MSRAHVFDKAVFHLGAVRSAGLPDLQAGVHIGLYFGWIVQRGFHSTWLEDRTPEPFAAFRARSITGPALLAHWDGALLDDMLGDEGLAFTADYYGPAGARWRYGYLDDYRATLAPSEATELEVADTWDAFESLCMLLDDRHRAWRATFDADAPRRDLRRPEGAPVAPAASEVTVVPVRGGVALPNGPLGLMATRPATVTALRDAATSGAWVGLFPTLDGGEAVHVDDVLPIGVWATVERVVETESGVDAVLACGGRIGRTRWVDDATWRAAIRVLDEAPVLDADAAGLERVRHLVAEHLRTRRERNESIGLLALAAGAQGPGLVDLVAREAALTFEEQLLVLEEPALRDRIEVVRAALLRGAR